MRWLNQLRCDHHVLRAKLDLLQSALGMGHDAWFVQREACYALLRRLQRHGRREQTLARFCQAVLSAQEAAALNAGHGHEQRFLGQCLEFFVANDRRSVERHQHIIRQFLETMRRHLALQETQLFPVFEQGLTEEVGQERQAVSDTNTFTETMTINCIVREHPETQPVFDRLCIRMPVEGYESLDEVAWRHGRDVHDVMSLLERVVHEEAGCTPWHSSTTSSAASCSGTSRQKP